MAAAMLAAQRGLISLIVSSDISYLSVVMMALFVGTSLYAGWVARQMDVFVEPKVKRPLTVAPQFSRPLAILHFVADNLFALGLLGTCVGLCYMMRGSLVETADVAAIISQLKVGTSTALYTTLVGIVTSLLLQLQTFLLEHRQ